MYDDMRNMRQPVAGITIQHDPDVGGEIDTSINYSFIMAAHEAITFTAMDPRSTLHYRAMLDEMLRNPSWRKRTVIPFSNRPVQFSAAERARSQAYVDASDKVNNPQPPAETGGGGSSQSYPYETRDFVIRDGGDAAVAAAASAQNGIAKERGDVARGITGTIGKVWNSSAGKVAGVVGFTLAAGVALLAGWAILPALAIGGIIGLAFKLAGGIADVASGGAASDLVNDSYGPVGLAILDGAEFA
jgi:hypothetical protein